MRVVKLVFCIILFIFSIASTAADISQCSFTVTDGSEERCSTTNTRLQDSCSIGMSPASSTYCVVWTSDQLSSGNLDIYVRLFDSSGDPYGGTTSQQAEKLVNEVTANTQFQPSCVGSLHDGTMLVLYANQGQDNPDFSYGVYGRIVLPYQQGSFQGSSFLINTRTQYDQLYPAGCALSDGYMVIWSSIGQDGQGYGIYAQRITVNGAIMLLSRVLDLTDYVQEILLELKHR